MARWLESRYKSAMAEERYDVAIVGASVAGATAAILFAQRGLRVALIERRLELNAYKRMCTHFILSCAVPTMRRLGVADAIERVGAVRNGAEFWTPWGWIRTRDTAEDPRPYGYNVRRQKLDPLLRGMAVSMRGVEYLPGESARALLERGGRIVGVALQNGVGRSREIRARLVVAADGRYSPIARMADIEEVIRPNHRAAFFAYFRDLPLASGSVSQVWLVEGDVLYAFPNDDGVTLLAFMPYKDRLREIKSDLERNFRSCFESLPNAPDLSRAKRISPILGMLDVPNIARRASRPGLALIGDSAMASDPVSGGGVGWAFQSAEWLVDYAAGAIEDGGPARVDTALERYRKAHRSRLGPHHLAICDFSSRRKFNLLEKLFFSSAPYDHATARHFEAFGNREISLAKFLGPRALARAGWVALRRKA